MIKTSANRSAGSPSRVHAPRRLTPPLTAGRRCGCWAIMQSRSRLLRCAATSYVEKNSVYASVTSLRLRRRYGRVDSEPVGPAPSKPVGRFRAAIEPEDLIEVKVRRISIRARAARLMPTSQAEYMNATAVSLFRTFPTPCARERSIYETPSPLRLRCYRDFVGILILRRNCLGGRA